MRLREYLYVRSALSFKASWAFHRLTPRGQFIRTLWTGALVIMIVFGIFYFPMRHVGLSVAWPAMSAGILLLPWIQQLRWTRLAWKQGDLVENKTDPPLLKL